jgi:hypothetical protein
LPTVRKNIWIGRHADDVWAVVADAGAIATWFPGIARSSLSGDIRTCVLEAGNEVTEQIVTCDHDLRRFQYRILSGIPVEEHLGTIDVIEADDQRCLLVYGTDVPRARWPARSASRSTRRWARSPNSSSLARHDSRERSPPAGPGSPALTPSEPERSSAPVITTE